MGCKPFIYRASVGIKKNLIWYLGFGLSEHRIIGPSDYRTFGLSDRHQKKNQASVITKSCYLQIRNIARIQSYTTEDACKTLVCLLVTSRLDYGNALLYEVNTVIVTVCSKYSC